MSENSICLAVKACLAKKLNAKQYLMTVEGKTSEEADAILASLVDRLEND